MLVEFHRFSGCPIARCQVDDLIEAQQALSTAGIETIVVLHSSEEKMHPNFDEVPGLHLIADREKRLYRAYQAEFRWRSCSHSRPGVPPSPPSLADTSRKSRGSRAGSSASRATS